MVFHYIKKEKKRKIKKKIISVKFYLSTVAATGNVKYGIMSSSELQSWHGCAVWHYNVNNTCMLESTLYSSLAAAFRSRPVFDLLTFEINTSLHCLSSYIESQTSGSTSTIFFLLEEAICFFFLFLCNFQESIYFRFRPKAVDCE